MRFHPVQNRARSTPDLDLLTGASLLRHALTAVSRSGVASATCAELTILAPLDDGPSARTAVELWLQRNKALPQQVLL